MLNFELGPRFVLELIKVFDGSFNGAVLYENPEYVTPNLIRRRLKLEKASKQHNRLEQKECTKVKDDFVRAVKFEDPIGNVFDTDNKDAPMEEVKVEDHVAAKLDKIILKKGKQSKKKKRKAATGNNVDTKRSKPDH